MRNMSEEQIKEMREIMDPEVQQEQTGKFTVGDVVVLKARARNTKGYYAPAVAYMQDIEVSVLGIDEEGRYNLGIRGVSIGLYWEDQIEKA